MKKLLLLVLAFAFLFIPATQAFASEPLINLPAKVPYLLMVTTEEKIQYKKDCARIWIPKQWEPECYRHTVSRTTGNAEKDMRSLLKKYSYALPEEIYSLNPGLRGRPFRRYENIIVPYALLRDQIDEKRQETIAKMSSELAASKEENSRCEADKKDLNVKILDVPTTSTAVNAENTELKNEYKKLENAYKLKVVATQRVYDENRNLAKMLFKCEDVKEALENTRTSLKTQISEIGNTLKIQQDQAEYFMNRVEQEVRKTTDIKGEAEKLAAQIGELNAQVHTLQMKLADNLTSCPDPALVQR